jgi:hypothetical protein
MRREVVVAGSVDRLQMLLLVRGLVSWVEDGVQLLFSIGSTHSR